MLNQVRPRTVRGREQTAQTTREAEEAMSKPREPMAGTEAQINAEVNEGGPVGGPVTPSEPSALERTTDLTRRLAVPKDEVVKPKPKNRAKPRRKPKR